jgi:hypothetical protein
MEIMIVGADNLGLIGENLRKIGITEIVHVTGRNASDRKRGTLSPSVKMVLILTDYINHATALVFKNRAKSQGIPLICAKRSWCSIEKKICELNLQKN